MAYRASTLYFAITDLGVVNPLYQFSMRWFYNLFMHTLALTNALKPRKSGQGPATVKIQEEEY